MGRLFAILGSISAALAVVMGAFGAHALRGSIPAELLDTFQTGARYHFYHSVGLIVVGIACRVFGRSRTIAAAGWSMLAGIVLFPGSLYALGLTGIRGLGAITPFGGALFIAAWVLLALSFRRAGGTTPLDGGSDHG